MGIDLREDWPEALTAAGFNPAGPSAWIAEGVLAYLPADGRLALVDRVRSLSAPDSMVAFDRIVEDPTAGDRLRNLSARSGIAMERLLAERSASDPAEILGAHGWMVGDRAATALATRYGRDLGDPFAAGDEPAAAESPWLETVFVTARLAP